MIKEDSWIKWTVDCEPQTAKANGFFCWILSLRPMIRSHGSLPTRSGSSPSSDCRTFFKNRRPHSRRPKKHRKSSNVLVHLLLPAQDVLVLDVDALVLGRLKTVEICLPHNHPFRSPCRPVTSSPAANLIIRFYSNCSSLDNEYGWFFCWTTTTIFLILLFGLVLPYC